MLWLLLGYMFLFIHRPFEIWPVLGEFRIERIYMLGTLLIVAGSPRKRFLPNRQHFAILQQRGVRASDATSQTASRGPSAGRRVIQLRAGALRRQHFTVGEQRKAKSEAGCDHAAGRCPGGG